MISDPEYNVFTSLLIKKEYSSDISDKIQIMIFLNELELKIFELTRINKNRPNEVSESKHIIQIIILEY